jgi:hypothetical protein
MVNHPWVTKSQSGARGGPPAVVQTLRRYGRECTS